MTSTYNTLAAFQPLAHPTPATSIRQCPVCERINHRKAEISSSLAQPRPQHFVYPAFLRNVQSEWTNYLTSPHAQTSNAELFARSSTDAACNPRRTIHAPTLASSETYQTECTHTCAGGSVCKELVPLDSKLSTEWPDIRGQERHLATTFQGRSNVLSSEVLISLSEADQSAFYNWIKLQQTQVQKAVSGDNKSIQNPDNLPRVWPEEIDYSLVVDHFLMTFTSFGDN